MRATVQGLLPAFCYCVILRRVTVSPCHRVTVSPCHRVTVSPCHRVTVSPCQPLPQVPHGSPLPPPQMAPHSLCHRGDWREHHLWHLAGGGGAQPGLAALCLADHPAH